MPGGPHLLPDALRRLALPLAVALGVLAVAGSGWSLWALREALLRWLRCPAEPAAVILAPIGGAAAASFGAIACCLAILSIAGAPKIVGWFSIAVGVLIFPVAALFYFLGHAALAPAIASSWLPCGLTEQVSSARALILALPVVANIATGAALLVRRGRFVAVASVVVLVLLGWLGAAAAALLS